MYVKDYTKEFYKLTIQSSHRELLKERIAWYINGFKFNIQDEVGMFNMNFSWGFLSVFFESSGEAKEEELRYFPREREVGYFDTS